LIDQMVAPGIIFQQGLGIMHRFSVREQVQKTNGNARSTYPHHHRNDTNHANKKS